MRVLMVNLPGEIVDGGCELMVQLTADLLRENQHDVSVIDHSGSVSACCTAAMRADETTAIETVLAIVRDWQPDIIHIHNLASRRLVQQLCRTGRAVRTFHDASQCCPLRKLLRPDGTICGEFACNAACHIRRQPRAWLRFLVYRRLQRTLPAIVPSNWLGDAYRRAGYKNVQVLPHFFAGARVTTTRRDPLVLFVGRLQPEKGIADVLALLTKLPAHVRVAISGNGDAAADVQHVLSNETERLIWDRGHTPAPRDALLKTAGCLVMPSRQPESFGLIGFLAALYEKPVVAYASGGIREWLPPEYAVPTGDTDALAAKVMQVLNGTIPAPPSFFDLYAERFPRAGYRDTLLRIYREARP